MKPSPLDLRHYFVTHVSMSANPDFDEDKDSLLHREDIQIDCDVSRVAEGGEDGWFILLNLRQNVGPEKNAPYNFAVKITGLFRVHPRWPDEPEQLVRTNGPSILFGACREVIRALTAQGPFKALVLPSVSFYSPEAAPRVPGAAAKPTASIGGRKNAGRPKRKAKG